MTDKAPTANDLIDDLARRYFHIEPDGMAGLAHGDGQVRLRRLPAVEPARGLHEGAGP